MLKNILTLAVWTTLLLTLGCNSSDTGSSLGVVSVHDDDPKMSEAIEKARATFTFFEKNWKTMDSDGYSLKFALPTSDGGIEHIWFSPTKIRGDQITGECANEPVNISGLELGDSRTVTRDDVSDWMIIVGNKCYGGYTIRVLAQRDPDAAPALDFVDPFAD